MKHRRKNTEQSLLNFVKAEYKHVADNIIIETDEGILMYNKYLVRKVSNLAVIKRNTDDLSLTFTATKTAAAWCILDKYNKIVEANRLCALDHKLGSLIVEEQQQLLRCRKPDSFSHFLGLSKLSEIRYKLVQTRAEIDKYINIANIWQNKDNKHGTFRTSN